MSTQSTVWVMILSDGVSEKISNLIDSGYFAEAQDLDWQLKSVNEKLSSLVSERGGQISLSTYNRQVLQLPITLAEELPLILAGYRKVFGMLMSVGMGLDLREASLAAKKSVYTNDIELYDPKDESYVQIKKSLEIEDDYFSVQPNQFDQTNPPAPKADSSKDSVGKYIPGLNAQQALEAENQMVQANVQQLMGPAQEMQQQMQQQQEQQAQQQQGEESGSLLESLSGEKKSDKPKTSTKEKKSSEDDEDSKSDEGSDKGDSEDSADSSEDEGSDANEKLGQLLSDVQDKMPKLMELHEKNPEAFKKVVTLIHKLVAVVKDRKKETKKAELDLMTEALNKALKIRWPAGTVRNRKKKVIIDGKAKWRGVAAGQVKDSKGSAISVQSHNAKAKTGEQGAN